MYRKFNLPVHRVDRSKLEDFIRYHFPIISKKLNHGIELELVFEKDHMARIATNDNDIVTLYMDNVEYMISLFETRPARKAWVLLLLAHEVLHTSAVLKYENFMNVRKYEEYINEEATKFLAANYKKYSINSIKKEYERWGKNTDGRIWELLSFDNINEWKKGE